MKHLHKIISGKEADDTLALKNIAAIHKQERELTEQLDFFGTDLSTFISRLVNRLRAYLTPKFLVAYRRFVVLTIGE